MGIERSDFPQAFPDDLAEGLQRIIAAVGECGPDLCRSYVGVAETAASIQSALEGYGFTVSPGQAEEVYALYSHNKWTSWLTGGCPTVQDAQGMLIQFSRDILFGENHAEL